MSVKPRRPKADAPEEGGDDALSGFIDEETYSKVADIQTKISEIDKAEHLKVLQIQHDYDRQKGPHFQDRAKIFRTIPEFWLKILSSHPQISLYLKEKNTNDVFKTLEDLNVEDVLTEKTSGFKITLVFGDNPFFSNKNIEITMTQLLSPPENEPSDFKVESSTIAWKKEKNIVELVDAQNKKKSEEKKKNQKSKGNDDDDDDDDDEILTFFSLLSSDPNLAYITGIPAPSQIVFSAIRDEIFFDPVAFVKNPAVIGDYDEPSDSESEDDDDGEDDEGAKGTKKAKTDEGDDDDEDDEK